VNRGGALGFAAELGGHALGHQSQGAVAGSTRQTQAGHKVLRGLLFLGGVSSGLHILVEERGVKLPKRVAVGAVNRLLIFSHVLIVSHTGSISCSPCSRHSRLGPRPCPPSLEDARRSTQRTLAQLGLPPLPMTQLPGANPGEASTPGGASVFTAVDKLGLKLDSRKAPVDVLVIDHLEKTPTEN
jgi:hypothetical protein